MRLRARSLRACSTRRSTTTAMCDIVVPFKCEKPPIKGGGLGWQGCPVRSCRSPRRPSCPGVCVGIQGSPFVALWATAVVLCARSQTSDTIPSRWAFGPSDSGL
jgi:hypothetical protein